MPSRPRMRTSSSPMSWAEISSPSTCFSSFSLSERSRYLKEKRRSVYERVAGFGRRENVLLMRQLWSYGVAGGEGEHSLFDMMRSLQLRVQREGKTW